MKRFFSSRVLQGACVSAFLLCGTAGAQGLFSYPGCADVTESQFKYVPLVGKTASTQTKALAIDNNLKEPIHMAMELRADKQVDIYFTQRNGTIKKYVAGQATVDSIGQIAVSNSGEMGLTGIVLDPNFKVNQRIYVFYTPPTVAFHRLSRFNLVAGKLDNSTEKVLLTVRRVATAHMGGAMTFDPKGDLWITTGNDGSDYPSSYSESSEGGSSEASSANFADFRGGVLRIHPDESTKGYTIPAGNAGAYWSNYFLLQANPTLAAEYADTAKVKPEIYVKGGRNVYSIAVDPVTNWVAFGSFGTNVTNGITEAHYLATHPVFVGYPYYAGGFGGIEPGNNFFPLWSDSTSNGGRGWPNFKSAHPGLVETTTAPINNSKWNKGPKQLPPVMPGMHSYLRGTVGGGAVTGSFYRYDSTSPSPVKFPPHFEGAWTITDWVQNNSVSNPAGGGFRGVKFFKLNSTGTTLMDSLKFFQTYGITGVLDFQQGPDGALYVLNYGSTYFGTTSETKISRIEYTGSCHPGVATSVIRDRNSSGKLGFTRDGSTFLVNLAGTYSVVVRDLRGRDLARLNAQSGSKVYRLNDILPAGTPPGVLTATASGPMGRETFRLYKD
jgi:cytochrome c